jgi:hypothetical protein
MKVQRLASFLSVPVFYIAGSLYGTAQNQSPTPMPMLTEEAGSNHVAVPSSALATDKTVGFAGNRELAIAGAPSPALPLKPGYVEPQPVVKGSLQSKTDRPSLRQVWIWGGLLAAEHSAAAFDGWTTRRSLTSGNGYERDPLMKPFANSAAIYPMLQIAPFGVDLVSHRMMSSRHAFFRRTWWIPQTVSIAASFWSGARNLHVTELICSLHSSGSHLPIHGFLIRARLEARADS